MTYYKDTGKGARYQMATPSTQNEIRVTQTGFDLASLEDIQTVKVGIFTPVLNMQEFVERLSNDAAKILSIVNAGLQDYTRQQLAADTSVAWQTESEDGVLTPFTGNLLSEDKSKQLAANVLNMAKMVFGYAKDMAGGKEAKRAAKEKAQAMLLANPQVVESLKAK